MRKSLSISIIIPAFNEANGIGELLQHLHKISDPLLVKEIILVDGQSTDATKAIAHANQALVLDSKKGRAKQMNLGAKNAKGNILYFLHADTFPPLGFDERICNAVNNSFDAGCFRMKFDTKNPFLRIFAYMTRFNHILCRGGDQSLFTTREVFFRNGGFKEDYIIYEDTEFIRRLYSDIKFKIIPATVITSARKYREKGWLKVQYHFAVIHLKNYLGAKPSALYQYYQRNLLS